MKFMKLLIILVCLILMVGCKDNDTESKPLETKDDLAEVKTFLTETELTSEESAYIEELRVNKILVVATRELDSVYEVDENGLVSGFNYLLLEQFANDINVKLEPKIVNFSDYFRIKGEVPDEVKNNPDYIYVPDLFSEVEIYCDVITVLPWREQIIRFIKIVPVRQIAITREGEELETLNDLYGRSIALKHDTSYEGRLLEIEKELNLHFYYYYVESTIEQQKAVSEGLADISIQDSNLAIKEIKKYDNLRMSIPIAEVQEQGWGVSKDNELLESILNKYIQYAKRTGIMDKLWHDEYGITLFEYLKLLE